MHIESQSGIVRYSDIQTLVSQLAELEDSEDGFLLHAGDCAELFETCELSRVTRDSKFTSDMGSIVNASIILGRICGQFGKPRSKATDDYGLPVFRGDIINGTCTSKRDADPSRMRLAHSLSLKMYSALTDLFISHECLLLPYESALVRYHTDNTPYNSSAHFLWIGDRTRALDGAHVEFCRGLANPIGIKVGPSSDPLEISNIVRRLNPENIAGKITIITRFGKMQAHRLPLLIAELKGLRILWQCDPMHGNTVQAGLFKTRYLVDIKEEIRETVHAHRMAGSRLHGIHLETTGEDNVTECVGGNVSLHDLPLKYLSACDPRLNPAQTREVLLFLNDILKESNLKRNQSTPSTTTTRDDFFSSDPDSGSDA